MNVDKTAVSRFMNLNSTISSRFMNLNSVVLSRFMNHDTQNFHHSFVKTADTAASSPSTRRQFSGVRGSVGRISASERCMLRSR